MNIMIDVSMNKQKMFAIPSLEGRVWAEGEILDTIEDRNQVKNSCIAFMCWFHGHRISQ